MNTLRDDSINLQPKYSNMKQKLSYVAPRCDELELRLEGFIAASPNFNTPFNEEEDF